MLGSASAPSIAQQQDGLLLCACCSGQLFHHKDSLLLACSRELCRLSSRSRLQTAWPTRKCICDLQARLVGQILAKKKPASGRAGMLASSDLKGVSNTIQRQAAKNLDFTYDIVKGNM